jgi:hypothetical protein
MQAYNFPKGQVCDIRFILENVSTTTKIKSLPFFDLGKPKTKSIEISKQGLVGTSNGVYSSCGCKIHLRKPINHNKNKVSTFL